jgi:hypothetical protein
MILASVVLYIVLIVWMIGFAVPQAASGAAQPPDLPFLIPVIVIFGLGFAAAALTSVWLLTAPEPVPGEGLRRSTLATWIRRLTAVSYGAGMLFMVVMLVALPMASGSPPFDLDAADAVFGGIYLVISILNSIAYAASFLLLLIHLRRLARRHYRKGLRILMTMLIWGSVGLGSSWFLFFIGALSMVASMAGAFAAATAPAAFTMTTAPPRSSSPRSAAEPVYDPSAVETPSDAGKVDFSAEADPSEFAGPSTLPAASPFAPTSMPVGAAGGPPPILGMSFAFFMVSVCLIEVLGFAWFVGGIVALFWFRAVFSRAIRENFHGAVPAA